MVNLNAYKAVISSNPVEFGPKLSKIFRNWRLDPEFSCANFYPLIEEIFGKPGYAGLGEAVKAALYLADEKTENGYHHHHHNREVIALTFALLARHKHLGLHPAITKDMGWLAIAAAAIHDYKHDGTSNKTADGVDPMRLEKLALSSARESLMEAGLNAQDWLKLSMMVLPTDITPSSQLSPSAQLKEIFLYHSSQKSQLDNIDPFFLSLLNDEELALCAQILGDADLGISAGLDPEMAKLNSAGVAIETNGAIPYTPQALNGFLNYVCEGFPASLSGKVLLTPGLKAIKSTARQDLNNDVRYEMK